MSYTLIEDVAENPLTNQYKNQQSSNANSWSNTPKQSPRNNFANNPQYDPLYNKYPDTSPTPMEYGVPPNSMQENQNEEQSYNNKRTKISKVISMPRTQSSVQSEETPSLSTTLVSNEDLKNSLKNIAYYMQKSVEYFDQKTNKLETKLIMIDQMLKGIGIILILLLIFMMIKK